MINPYDDDIYERAERANPPPEGEKPYSRDCVFPNFEDWCDSQGLDDRIGENHIWHKAAYHGSNCRELAKDRGYEDYDKDDKPSFRDYTIAMIFVVIIVAGMIVLLHQFGVWS